MSDWHQNLPPEKARQQMAAAERIREHFHACRACGQTFEGEIRWVCPPNSPTLLAVCSTCEVFPR